MGPAAVPYDGRARHAVDGHGVVSRLPCALNPVFWRGVELPAVSRGMPGVQVRVRLWQRCAALAYTAVTPLAVWHAAVDRRDIHHNFFMDNYSPQENVDNDDGSRYYNVCFICC